MGVADGQSLSPRYASAPALGDWKDVDLPGGVVVGAITRDSEFVTLRGDTVIQAGDHVVVFTEADTVEAVLEMF